MKTNSNHKKILPSPQCENFTVARPTPDVSGRGLTWVDAVNLYPASKECLGAFLVASAAEVLAGVKPANLIRMLKRDMPCGRSIYRLWKLYGAELLEQSQLSALELREEDDALLLLFYRPDLLERRLSGRTMQVFLKRRGYPQHLNLKSALDYLCQTFSHQGSPDEVGMFLGYPLKDVHGFIDQRPDPWQGRCLWRIYGPPQRSLRLYQRYFEERNELTSKLARGYSPSELLKAA